MKAILAAVFVVAFTGAAYAADGVIEINQARALAGGVTPGDVPGFPVTISQPGSYRFTGDLTPGAGVDGINITADNVTIDLNGFAIVGPAVGIRGVGFVNTSVVNGSIVGVTNVGIDVGHLGHVERVRVIGTDASPQAHGRGIRGATGMTVSACTVSKIYYGIEVGSGLISGNTVIDNYVGIIGGGLVAGNIILNNYLGLNLLSGAYGGNVLQGNGIQVNSQTQTSWPLQVGPNACGSGLCP